MEEGGETIRCCSDCKTIKTPMWRGGPAGPKSLCNACGIRFRKQRRSEFRIIHSQKAIASKNIKPTSFSSSSSSYSGFSVKKRRSLKEEEQAALCLLLLSCSSVFV